MSSWTSPRTWIVGEPLFAALLNTHLRDNQLTSATAQIAAAGDIVFGASANGWTKIPVGEEGEAVIVDPTTGSTLKFASPGLQGESFWGGNLIRNYPSRELADGAQPDWWDESTGCIALTEEDATGESIEQKHERVLKVVNTGDGGAGNRIEQVFVHTAEPTLDEAVTKVSGGMWAYSTASGATIQLYDTGGDVSLGTEGTSASGWQWVEVLGKTIGTTSLGWRAYHTSGSNTFYVAYPTLNQGGNVKPWQERDSVFVEKRVSALSTNPSNETFNDLDLTSVTDALCNKVTGIWIKSGAGGEIHARRNGDSAGADNTTQITSDEGTVNERSGMDAGILTDAGQIIEWSVSASGITSLTYDLHGFYKWKS